MKGKYEESCFVFVKEPKISPEVIAHLDNSLRNWNVPFSKIPFQTLKPVPVLPFLQHYQKQVTEIPNIAYQMIYQMSQGGIQPFIYYGEQGLIHSIRTIVGATNPAEAEKFTIRNTFSNDSLETAIAENRPVRNIIHASDSPENAEREISLWLPHLEFRVMN